MRWAVPGRGRPPRHARVRGGVVMVAFMGRWEPERVLPVLFVELAQRLRDHCFRVYIRSSKQLISCINQRTVTIVFV